MPFDTSETSKCCLTEQIEDYVQSLHRVSEAPKRQYQALLNRFAAYLVSKGIKNFEDVSKTEIGQFLTTKKTSNTRNLYIFLIRSFYSNYLGKEKLVMQLHQKPEQETITPSELLTPSEVIALANEVMLKKKDIIFPVNTPCSDCGSTLRAYDKESRNTRCFKCGKKKAHPIDNLAIILQERQYQKLKSAKFIDGKPCPVCKLCGEILFESGLRVCLYCNEPKTGEPSLGS